MTVKPAVFIPTHWQRRPEVAASFARTGRTRFPEVVPLTKPRETAEITFDQYELRVRVRAPEVFAESTPPEVHLNAYTKDDPFTDTDLPVKL